MDAQIISTTERKQASQQRGIPLSDASAIKELWSLKDHFRETLESPQYSFFMILALEGARQTQVITWRFPFLLTLLGLGALVHRFLWLHNNNNNNKTSGEEP